jgi:hypothetical protein
MMEAYTNKLADSSELCRQVSQSGMQTGQSVRDADRHDVQLSHTATSPPKLKHTINGRELLINFKEMYISTHFTLYKMIRRHLII